MSRFGSASTAAKAPSASDGLVTTRVPVPGTSSVLHYEREAATGALRSIRGGGRLYLEATPDGRKHFDGGFVRVRETKRVDGFDREVEAAGEGWRERYRWGRDGKLREVDGVEVHRDEQGRVVAVVDRDGPLWTYAYGRRGLVSVGSPRGRTAVARDAVGRPRTVRSDGLERTLEYDASGRRRDAAGLSQDRCHRDGAGRVWCVRDGEGRIASIFLWDGHRCLGRIDGPVGAPLAAVFSLDPSATPVRVVTREGGKRVPRDAFGEGLLELDGVPGLFGGFVADDLVHLPLRSLDPRVGAFCAPDPLHGGADDPRRGSRGAYTGPLASEPEAWSAYAICRDDPVGRGDPTGGLSGWLVFSSLTWSLQNNLIAFFGVDWWFNLFGSLFTGFQYGDFASSEGLVSSDRLGAFGVRRDGVISEITGGRAFTTAHIVWSPASKFEELQEAFVLDPGGAYEPTLYGTLLRGRPEGEASFLFHGMRDPGGGLGFPDARSWSRHGGPAAPVCPGAVVPRFPSGGFHFEDALEILAPRACPLDELRPGERTAVGTLEPRATVRVPLTGTVPARDDRVLLADGDDDLLVTRVVSSSRLGGRQLVRFEDDAPAVGPTGVTLTLLENAPASEESLAAAPVVSDGLTAAGASATYAPGDLLRTTSGPDVTAARVDRLEARLPLDRPLPTTISGPILLRRTTVSPAGQTVAVVDADHLDFSGGTPPPAPSMGLVRGAGPEIPVRVLDASDPANVELDTEIAAAGPGPVDFFPITAGSTLGRRSGNAESAALVTYTPEAQGRAPDGSAGTVIVRFEAAGEAAVRRVTGPPTYDAIVLDRSPAGSGPWRVERFVARRGTAPIEDQEVVAAASLAVDPADAVAGAAALRLDRVDAASPDAGAPPAVRGTHFGGFAVNGEEVTGTQAAPSPGAGAGNPRPGQVVVLTGLGDDTPAVVRRIRVAPTFDRTVPVTGEGIEAVLLGGRGFRYEAERLADDRLVARGRAEGSAGLVEVAFPRFGKGETVEVSWAPHGPGDRDRYRISHVSGTSVTLEGGGPVTAARTDLRIRRLVPVDPGTGSSLLAREGIAGDVPGASSVDFSVWNPLAFPEGRVVGVVQGEHTWPAVVTGVAQDVSLELGADTGLAGTGDVAAPAVTASQFVSRFVRDGDVLLVAEDTTTVASGPAELVLVTPYVESGNAAPDARLSAGTLRVPEDESVEIDRRQSLVDHELMHTLQYSYWGPLWFCYFPMLLLELPVELATDAERPAYDPFFEGTLRADGSFWALEVAGGGAADVAVDDTLQIVQGANVVSATVGEVDGTALRLRMTESGTVPPTGAVHARRRNSAGPWDEIFDVLQFFTHGGLLNGVVGTTWASILWGLGKLFWGLGRAISGTGDLHPGTVEDAERRIVRLTTPEGRSGLADATQVIVRQGEVSVVRSARLSEDLLTVGEPLGFDGEVRVARYASLDPGSTFDWLRYDPATVPDPANPFRIDVPGRGDAFSSHDRIEIAYRDRTFRTWVTGVEGDTVQIEDRVPLVNGERSLRVASVGSGDPMGQADSHLATEMGMGWMRWLFDPWGRIDVAAGPDQPRWLDIVLRSVRYLTGTQMWSMLPVLGYVFWGRFFGFLIPEHLTAIEQEASEESGDLYTPLSRLTGEVRRGEGFGHYEAVVGDVARLRNWTVFRDSSLVGAGSYDAPGVRTALGRLRFVADRATTAASAEPNGTVESGASDPGAALYDRFTRKDDGDPHAAAAADPGGFLPSALGHIPDLPTSVRHVGGYAAFTRPGEHRLTVMNDLDPTNRSADENAREAREAQENERQTVFFDVTARDVAVRVNGREVGEGGSIEFVHTQEARVEVTPDGVELGARRFRATVRRPDDGPLLQVRNDRCLVAQTTDGSGEPVEVCRFYGFDPATGSYPDASLSAFGVHLGEDLFVPVRRFTVDVVSTVPLRGEADPDAGALSDLAQGEEAVLLVPAAVRGPVTVSRFDGRAPGDADPSFQAARVEDPGEATGAFLGPSGSAFTVGFGDAPELGGPVPVELSIPVGVPGGLTSTLSASFTLTPP